MKEIPTKPYLIRAIYEWCTDSGLTPYLSVHVNERTRVPMEYVKNGEIVLNISHAATHNITLGSDLIQFSARFNGVSRELSIPIDAVAGIFARENGQGLFFQDTKTDTQEKSLSATGAGDSLPNDEPPGSGNSTRKPKLQIIK